MTKKSTKRSLLLSVLSLLVCCSMLIGSTFAWFTDSVTSGSNVITSGNLDIEVQYTLDGTNWSNLQGATDLFSKGLWEPGHTEVVVLKIENKGSLALKYNANMNIFNETIGKTKDGKDIVLSDILTVSTLTQQVNAIGDIAVDLVGEDVYYLVVKRELSLLLEKSYADGGVAFRLRIHSVAEVLIEGRPIIFRRHSLMTDNEHRVHYCAATLKHRKKFGYSRGRNANLFGGDLFKHILTPFHMREGCTVIFV